MLNYLDPQSQEKDKKLERPFALPPVQITQSFRRQKQAESGKRLNLEFFLERQMRGRQITTVKERVLAKQAKEEEPSELIFNPSLGIPDFRSKTQVIPEGARLAPLTALNVKKLERLTGKQEEPKPVQLEETLSVVRRDLVKAKEVPVIHEIEEAKTETPLFKGVTLDRKSPELQKHFMLIC